MIANILSEASCNVERLNAAANKIVVMLDFIIFS